MSRQRFAATFFIMKAPVLASAVMFHAWLLLPLQSWISMPVAFAVPLPIGPTHLLVFAFLAVVQFEPLGTMVNFCASLFIDAYCWMRVPLLVEPPATSSAFPPADIGARL